jgi:outer membrane protein OmpA-like peptidoglycan-associated protein
MAVQPVSNRKRWFLGVAVATGVTIAFPKEARPISCVDGPFMIFFDLNEDRLTAHAAAVLDNMLAARNMCGHDGRLAIAGHADRSGSSRHNRALSKRRAERVRAYASAQGVADEMMRVEAHGEDQPLVETSDGVQEPQNRRVEIRYPPPDGW